MPDSTPLRIAPRLVAWGSALVAAPVVVGLLRVLPATSVTDVPWLPATAHVLLALAAAIATARLLTHALRSGDARGGMLAAGAGMLAAGSAVAGLTVSAPPAIAIGVGLAGAGLASLLAAFMSLDVRPGPVAIATGVLAASVALLAGALFVPWPESAGPVLAAVAVGSLVVAASRGTLPLGPLALLAGGAAALGLARSGSVEGIVALVPLVAACLLLTVEPADRRPASSSQSLALPSPALPPLAHDLAEGVLLLDRDERLIDWNVAATTLLELGAHPRGQSTAEILVPLIGEAAWAALTLSTGDAPGRVVTERGRPLELTTVEDGDGIILLVRDLSLERNEATEAARLARELRGTIEELLDARRTVDLQRNELERAALVDALTGVASRRAFLDRLRTETAQARRYNHPVAVVVIDVDAFGALNREHGLSVGDAVLRELALRLRLRIREADALGRLGSDCFAAILPHTDVRGAAIFADAVLRRMVTRPVETAAGALTVAISVGVALMRPGTDLDDERLLAAADEALASARRGGGNRIAFDREHGLVRLDERRPAGNAPDSSVEDESAGDDGA